MPPKNERVVKAFPRLGIEARPHGPETLRHLEAYDALFVAREKLEAGETLTPAEREAALDGLILKSA